MYSWLQHLGPKSNSPNYFSLLFAGGKCCSFRVRKKATHSNSQSAISTFHPILQVDLFLYFFGLKGNNEVTNSDNNHFLILGWHGVILPFGKAACKWAIR